MMSDTSKILNVFVAFCRENLDILMIGGVVLIAVVIAVSFLKTSKKNEDEDLDFYEELEKKETKEAELSKDLEAQPKDLGKDETDLTEIESQSFTVEKDGKNEIDTLVNEAFDKFIENSFSDAFKTILEEIDEEYEQKHMVVLEKEFQEEPAAEEEAIQEPVALDGCLDEFSEDSDGFEIFEEAAQEQLKEAKLVELPCAGGAEGKLPQEESCFEKVTNTVSKNTSCIEYIVEGLASLSGEGVKEVGIKIPGAEVKITYCKEDAESEEVSKTQESDETKAEETLESPTDEDMTDDDKTESQPQPRKKFGPDNMNVSRSGKVYSEEELELQIRD